jgi:hypothetical protein
MSPGCAAAASSVAQPRLRARMQPLAAGAGEHHQHHQGAI